MTPTTPTTGAEIRKRGRPKKDTGLIFFRDRKGRVKAWNPAANAAANTPGRIPEAVRLYDGLGHDWPVWGKPLTRDGDYNAARRTPFRQRPEGCFEADVKALDEMFAAASGSSSVLLTLAALGDLFAGHRPPATVVLHGVFWTRFLANVFIREAGADGINRSRFEKPDGKVWASVNVLPSAGGGYNYTDEAWYSVVNMVRPPVFCVKVEGDRYMLDDADSDLVGGWEPETLAACVLESLWRRKGVNSCAALDSPPETVPQGTALAQEAPPPCEDNPPPPATPSEAVSEPAAGPQSEADAGEEMPAKPGDPVSLFAAGKTWGEIKAGDVWLKGLTTAKDLQAPMPLSRVLAMTTDHEVTRRLTEECRAIGDKKARNEFKRDNLHVWYAAPVFADRFKGSVKGNVAGYTGLACLDFDGMKSLADAEAARDDLFMEFKEILFAAVSASGLGVYVLVTLDFDGTEEGYKTALSAAFEAFEAKGYMPDTGCADPTRARYLSSDPDALQRPDDFVPRAIRPGEGDGYFVLPASMLRQCWTNSARKRKGAGKEYLKEALERIARAGDGMKDTTITSVMGTCSRLIRNYGMDAGEVYDRVRKVASAYGYDTKKTADKIRRLGVENGEADNAR